MSRIQTSSAFVRDEMNNIVLPSRLTLLSRSLPALSVTRSNGPVATPVPSSTGTRHTPTFSTTLEKAARLNPHLVILQSGSGRERRFARMVGIHTRQSVIDGEKQGRLVGDYVVNHRLRPLGD